MLSKRQFWKYLTRLHRWIGMVLGVQILIWFLSGFFMSFFDIESVRGTHIAEKASFSLDLKSVKPLSDIGLKRVTNVALKGTAGGGAVYAVNGDNSTHYIDAETGDKWAGMTEKNIRLAASVYYTGDTMPISVRQLFKTPIEYRGALPVWQVTYGDGPKTRLYLDAQTGELKAVRTWLWRVFDFMWMLHIMDYDDRDDINNWWLWLASFFAALFALSGLALVFHRTVLRPKAR